MTEYNFERLQGESKFRHLVRLAIAKLNKEHSMDWLELVDMFGLDYSAETLRKKSYGWKDFVENEEIENLNSEEEITYKETTEILANGSQKSDKLIKMSVEQSKDVNYLLEAHGFDKKEWELVNAKNNIWNVNSKSQGVQTLYSSKITVKPKVNGFDIDKLIEVIKTETKPLYVDKPSDIDGDKLLEIPLFDMHFGIADLDYYKDTYARIVDKIESKNWDKILFIIGQDLLHNDGFEGKTTSGTPIDKVAMEKAWDDADTFYVNLIKKAIPKANKVNVIYSNGNHDKGITFGFVKMLERTFPQVEFESSMKQRKAFIYNDVFIGITHGDKGGTRMTKNFYSEYGKYIANAEVVEIHSGHLHHEKSKDDLGFLVRTLATSAKTDDYHYDNGWIGAHKRFQLFEFSKDSLDGIYYV